MTADAAAQTPPDSYGTATTWRDLALLMVGAFVLYTVNIDFTLYGDAAEYSDYVMLHKFDELTLHLGYYYALFGMHKLLGGVFGIPIEESAVWLNVVAGTLAVGAAYLLAHELLGTRRDALLCAVIFAVSGRVLNNATSSEIYMLQTFLVLSSFYLFVRERIVLAGLVGALALLVSPLSAFAYLFYPVYDYQRAGKIRSAVWARLAGAALVIYLPFLIIDGHELLYGLRGLLVINAAVKDDPLGSIKNFPIYQFKAFSLMALLIIPALFAVSRNRRMIALALAVAVPHLYIIFKLTGEDHVFILNTDFFFACLLVIGWRQLEQFKSGRWVPPVLLAAHVALFVVSGTIHTFDPHRDYAQDMRRVAKTYLVGRDAMMITDWGRGVSLVFFGRPTHATTVLDDPLTAQIFNITGSPLPTAARLVNHEVFLLDEWAPSPLNRLLRSKASLEAYRRENSNLGMAERELHLQCTLLEETSHRIYRCVPRAT
ncbi:MAG: hypothetical protein M3081_23035 [Gemmatimonadota bacterium]|nr:hypothetical protein [Gemmatimonadota bacterium]